jgi:S1-C subfamily serine protease
MWSPGPRLLASVAALSVAGVSAGCAGLASAPPTKQPRVTVAALHPVDPGVGAIEAAPIPQLISKSLHRKAEEMVVRVRNINCLGLDVGSGFAIDAHTLLTNRHVLAGASELEISTWDGHDEQVAAAGVGRLVDLGVVRLDGTLPYHSITVAKPVVGERVHVVGFPLGGPLTFSYGRIVGFVSGTDLGVPGQVMRLTADVQPGNSGGPVLDTEGRVVGIVYAIELSTGYGLAIPLDTLRKLIQAGGFQTVPPCGSE